MVEIIMISKIDSIFNNKIIFQQKTRGVKFPEEIFSV